MITLRYYEMNDNDFISLIFERNMEDYLHNPLVCDDEIVIYRGNGYKRNKSIINKIQEIIKSLENKNSGVFSEEVYKVCANDKEALRTLKEIEEALGYRVMIVKEENKDAWKHWKAGKNYSIKEG